jgi:hypothetical protein
VTLPESHARSLTRHADRLEARFQGVSTVGLCQFIAFDLEARDAGRARHHRFVMNVPLDGAPEDRQARLVQHILADRSRFLRYLLLLLAGDDSPGDIVEFAMHIGQPQSRTALESGLKTMPLLEEMVRALARRPERIRHVKRVIDDLQQTEEGRDLLPEGFEDVWRPIEARWLESMRS